MPCRGRIGGAAAVTAAVLLGGCGIESTGVNFSEPAGEVATGPGLFSGQDGVFTVYDSAADRVPASNSGAAAAGAAGAGAGSAAATRTPAPGSRVSTERVLLPDGRVMERTITVEERVLPAGS